MRSEIQAVQSNLEKTEATLRSEIQAVQSNLERTESSLRNEIQAVRAEIKALEQRLLIKLGSLLLIALTLMTAINRFLGPATQSP